MHLEDISGYWEYPINTDMRYHLGKGSIIIQNDGWFEGFIIENGFIKKENKLGFVYGIYFPNKIIELFYCCDGTISRFRCEKDITSYNGIVSTIGPCMEVPGGQCSITTFGKSISSEEMVISRTNIAKSLMNDRERILYHRISENRDGLMVLECYQNWKLKKISDILEIHDKKTK